MSDIGQEAAKDLENDPNLKKDAEQDFSRVARPTAITKLRAVVGRDLRKLGSKAPPALSSKIPWLPWSSSSSAGSRRLAGRHLRRLR